MLMNIYNRYIYIKCVYMYIYNTHIFIKYICITYTRV